MPSRSDKTAFYCNIHANLFSSSRANCHFLYFFWGLARWINKIAEFHCSSFSHPSAIQGQQLPSTYFIFEREGSISQVYQVYLEHFRLGATKSSVSHQT